MRSGDIPSTVSNWQKAGRHFKAKDCYFHCSLVLFFAVRCFSVLFVAFQCCSLLFNAFDCNSLQFVSIRYKQAIPPLYIWCQKQ
jgi:hypothetical protein